MKFYDLNTFTNYSKGTNSVLEITKFAEQLGYSGIAITDNFQGLDKLKEQKEAIKLAQKEVNIEIFTGTTIQTKDVSELNEIIKKVRDSVQIVIVHGGTYAINRRACEDSRVDILAHPELERTDNGLDEACLNAAKKNDVAIQINFREILHTYRRLRTYILSHIAKNIKLAEKLNVKLVTCSGAQSIWDMRDPRELVAITNVLGLELNRSFSTISETPQHLIEKNKSKLEGKIIREGVEVI